MKKSMTHCQAKFWGGGRDRSGSTLLEVMVSLMVLGILTAAVYSGLNNGAVAAAISAQHVSAFGLCKERLEQMRGADFDQVTSDNFPNESVEITHLGGMNGKPLIGQISNTIHDLANPARKRVTVRVRWTCAGKPQEESVTGEIVDRDALSSEMGIITGWIALHPNRKLPVQFRLVKADGSVIKKVDLKNPSFTGFWGYTRLIRFKPGGGGVQTTLHYNYQPYPISNANRWDLRNSQKRLWAYLVKSSTDHKWYIYVSGANTVITSR